MHEQRRLADARLTPDQDDAAGNYPAAEHPVELAPGQGATRSGFGFDLAQRHRPAATRLDCLPPPTQACLAAPASAGCGLPHVELLERVPGVAVRALAGPAQALAP